MTKEEALARFKGALQRKKEWEERSTAYLQQLQQDKKMSSATV